jgi:hypothetical protein
MVCGPSPAFSTMPMGLHGDSNKQQGGDIHVYVMAHTTVMKAPKMPYAVIRTNYLSLNKISTLIKPTF